MVHICIYRVYQAVLERCGIENVRTFCANSRKICAVELSQGECASP